MSTSVRVFSSADEMAQAVAMTLVKDLDRLEPDQFYSVALSGGSTPLNLFRFLAANYAERVKWEQLLVFWADERCVPPDDENSNFRLAWENLLMHVPIPDVNLFRIRGEDDPETEAANYSGLLTATLPLVNGTPQFDLMLLGIGTDGHTASIFPGDLSHIRSTKLYEVSQSPAGIRTRITATGRTINNSSKVFFMATGKEKASQVDTVINMRPGYEYLPSAHVRPLSGQLVWLLDREAAGTGSGY